jgi:hypothetical protein
VVWREHDNMGFLLSIYITDTEQISPGGECMDPSDSTPRFFYFYVLLFLIKFIELRKMEGKVEKEHTQKNHRTLLNTKLTR